MVDAKQELVRNWLTKASHDLEAARTLALSEHPLLDVAIYHCQQAAEKAVKGFLVFHDQPFEKTHDIEELLSVAGEVDQRILQWNEAGEYLTPYVSLFRYPGTTLEPTQREFELALTMADDLFRVICSFLPENVHPPERE
ncbi:MAG: HEPN domain-containing protein [Ignavibacteriae bacterium]|nr:HEPN domain-containing protein [Ignavibacteriota bacterium]